MAEERVRKEEMMIEERMKKKLQNQIEIPKCVEDKMQDAYQQIYQGRVRMKPQVKKRIPKWAKAAVAATCVIFAGGVVLVSNPALARDLPLIGNVFDRMEEAREADPVRSEGHNCLWKYKRQGAVGGHCDRNGSEQRI